jgi:Domain of unknown function (DUF4062)
MATEVKKVRIFVASPGDVQSERDQLEKVVSELNLTISAIAPDKKIVLELVRWEKNVHPGLGRDPQDVVNQQIGQYDIFVGILWKRMGTPTAEANSGTEEEFQVAYDRWEKNKALPVLFYFCQQPFPPPRTPEEVDQLGKVVAFRRDLALKGLIADYATHEGFADVIRPHLLLALGRLSSSQVTPSESLHQAAGAEVASARPQILALSMEYDHIRATMEAGDQRTRLLDAVVSEMRKLALKAYPLLPELAGSASPGQRLAAVVILGSIPDANYLPWLAERLRLESPFLGYQAALAVLAAVRALYESKYEELRSAIVSAKSSLAENVRENASDPVGRLAILEEAERDLQQLSRR